MKTVDQDKRRLLQALTATGATAIVPGAWAQPAVDAVVLPPHAQCTVNCDPDPVDPVEPEEPEEPEEPKIDPEEPSCPNPYRAFSISLNSPNSIMVTNQSNQDFDGAVWVPEGAALTYWTYPDIPLLPANQSIIIQFNDVITDPVVSFRLTMHAYDEDDCIRISDTLVFTTKAPPETDAAAQASDDPASPAPRTPSSIFDVAK